MRAFYRRAVTLVASVDGLHGEVLPISIEAVCDVPDKLASGAARLAGSVESRYGCAERPSGRTALSRSDHRPPP